MKKQILIIFTTISLIAYSQDSTSLKNEIGVDVTSIFREVFGRNYYPDYYPGPYYGGEIMPKYYLSYRRSLGKGNLRLGAGGVVNNGNRTYVYHPDSAARNSKSNYNSYDIRIGYEFLKFIHKKWAMYYGLDFRPSISNSSRLDYYTSNYTLTNETNTMKFGFAPIIGLRFNVNDRLSIMAEGNCLFEIQRSKTKNIYTALNPLVPNIPTREQDGPNSTGLTFVQPFSLVVGYKF